MTVESKQELVQLLEGDDWSVMTGNHAIDAVKEDKVLTISPILIPFDSEADEYNVRISYTEDQKERHQSVHKSWTDAYERAEDLA